MQAFSIKHATRQPSAEAFGWELNGQQRWTAGYGLPISPWLSSSLRQIARHAAKVVFFFSLENLKKGDPRDGLSFSFMS